MLLFYECILKLAFLLRFQKLNIRIDTRYFIAPPFNITIFLTFLFLSGCTHSMHRAIEHEIKKAGKELLVVAAFAGAEYIIQNSLNPKEDKQIENPRDKNRIEDSNETLTEDGKKVRVSIHIENLYYYKNYCALHKSIYGKIKNKTDVHQELLEIKTNSYDLPDFLNIYRNLAALKNNNILAISNITISDSKLFIEFDGLVYKCKDY